jgi:hypothetical protein
MSNVLLGFGDSWAAGSELSVDEKPYLDLLADQLGIPCINYATPSSSIPHLVLQFQQFLETRYFPKHQYHAVFFLTAKERTFAFDHESKDIIHCSPQQALTDPMAGGYYRVYTDKLGDFNLNTTVLALQRLCSLYNINDHYVLGWQQTKLWPSVDSTKFFRSGEQAITTLFHNQGHLPLATLLDTKNEYIWPNHGHPNQHGHQRIAQELGDWINVH